jgi:hypothetical protein
MPKSKTSQIRGEALDFIQLLDGIMMTTKNTNFIRDK